MARRGVHPPEETQTPAFLAHGGAAGQLMRSVDWARTPVGPVSA